MQNYQLWLTPEQKNRVLNYIKDRRYRLMIGMYFSLVMSFILAPLAVWDFHDIERQIMVRHHDARKDSTGIFIILLIWNAVMFLVNFVRGIGKDFWKNSDYDCMKHDNYTLDFRECAGKLPDSGKHPYFVTDSDGNAYQCCMKFLEWKHLREGEIICCITLRNGQKYALLTA